MAVLVGQLLGCTGIGSFSFDIRIILPDAPIPNAPIPNAPPAASFTATPTSGEAPLAVSFDGSGSSDSDGSIVTYSWS